MPNAAGTPTQVLQGVEVPASAIDPATFFRLTRRLAFLVKMLSYSGLGSTDQVPILQTGILTGLRVRFAGSLVVTPGSGTVATTWRWPYDLFRAVRFSANGQSNLINCSGWKLKAREMMALGDLTDRGVAQSINNITRTQGTLSLNSESWGVGQAQTAIAAGTYPIELELYVPVAHDDKNLVGAIFAQTSATDLVLAVDWANLQDIFTLTSNATAVLTGNLIVEAKSCSIPQAPNGQVIVPDLRAFHSLIQSRLTGLGTGDNEVRLAGQGVGKQLLRVLWQVYNGAVPQVPLSVNAANFNSLAWRFGSNDTPEVLRDGASMAHELERLYGLDPCTLQGFAGYDFCSENAFRDTIDEAAATELRLLINIANSVAINNANVEYVQEALTIGAAA